MNTYALSAWSVLGDPSRRGIIERLVRGPSSVAELARDLPISRPAVSQHLRLLKEVGLVHDSPQGTRRIYVVDVDTLDRFRRELDDFWGATLSQYATEAGGQPATGTESPAAKKQPPKEGRPSE